MKEVTEVENLNRIIGNRSFEEMMFSIRRDDYMNVILQLRKIYASGDKTAYGKAKKALRAFTPSGTYKGRRLPEFMLQYSYIIVLDFDKLSPSELIRVREIVCGCPFTVACFISPTGNGLKVFVCVKSGPEKHLKAFLSIRKYYTLITGVEIDASGKDITRLCFVSWDPALYYNPAAKVFDWEKRDIDKSRGDNEDNVGRPLVGLLTGNKDSLLDSPGDPQGASLHHIDAEHQKKPDPVPTTGTDNIFKIYKKCLRFVLKYHQYMQGQRHTFILKLALEIRKKGISEVSALYLIQQDYDLEISEIIKIVKDVYQFDLTRENQSSIPETPTIAAVPKTSSSPSPQHVETHYLASIPNGKKPPSQPQAKPVNPIDPDREDIIFPLMDELDEIYYSGGEPIQLPESAAQAKLRIKMSYGHSTVEMMLTKVLDFQYNVISGRTEWHRKGTDDPFLKVEDHEANSMLRWLHLHDQIIPVSMLYNILTSNFSKDFNPFSEYFKNLKKVDPAVDYIGQLIATVKTEDDKYWEFCCRKWFVAYAMSLYRKKVINHTVIVFVGAQGCGKTSWARLLVPKALKKYLSPSAMTSDSKDTKIMLAECCLIILDELEAFNRRDLATFKDMITLEFVYVRRPYGRYACNLSRYASFIASVNSTQILTDPTGTRRYLCSTAISIDYEHTVDIDACMAQAIALGTSGFKYWFDQEEIKELTHHNEAYMARTIEEETIESWMQPVSIEEWNNKANLTYGRNICLMKASDISGFILTKSKLILQNNTNANVGKFMKKMKFIRLCKKTGFYYIVRILTDEEVAGSRRTLDDSETPADFEKDLNRYNNPNQFIESSRKEDELPF